MILNKFVPDHSSIWRVLPPELRSLAGTGLVWLVLVMGIGARPVQSSAAPAAGAAPTALAMQAAELVQRGFDLLAQNEPKKAESAFRRVIGAQPELAEAHRGLGLSLWTQGQKDEAVRELTVAARLDPRDADAHFTLGKIAWALSRESSAGAGELSKTMTNADSFQSMAVAEISKAVELRPNDFEIRSSLAELDLEAGRAKDALEQASQAAGAAVSPREHAAAHRLSGRAFFALGEDTRAEAEFRAALEVEPNDAEAHFELGHIRVSQKRMAQAEEELRQAIRLSPDFAPVYSALAEILMGAGRTGEARQLLEKAVGLDARDWQSRYRLARLLTEAGQGSRATELLEEVTRLNPSFLPAREELGLGLLCRGDSAGAAREAEALMAAHPKAAEGHRLMALVLWKKRDIESSLAECVLALSSDPDSTAMMALQSLELWQLDRKKEAREAFVQAAKAEPRLGTAEVFCRLICCEARDIGPVDDFLRRNRWLLAPPASP